MKKSNRNSIIELVRLLASIWIVYYHNMFVIANNTSKYFDGGRIAVDFFFILSGLFFIKSHNSCRKNSFIHDFVTFALKRIKSMGIALPIGLIFSTIFFVIFPTNNYGTNFIFGYLWFIPAMFVAFLLYFVIFEIKNTKLRTSTITAIVICCYILAFTYRQQRIFSAFAGIGLGILLSMIPQIKWLEKLLPPPTTHYCDFVGVVAFVHRFCNDSQKKFVG